MTRWFLIVAVILAAALLLYLFLPKPKQEWVRAEQHDLELSLSLPYQLNVTSFQVTAPQAGLLIMSVEAGERVEAGQILGSIKGAVDLSIRASTTGIVTLLENSSSRQVAEGEPILAILPNQGQLICRLTTEQAKALESFESLEVKFPFSAQRIWTNVQEITQGSDRWDLTLNCIDFLSSLAQKPTGTLTAYYGVLPEAVMIPTKTLFVEDGQLGVYLLTETGKVFQPVTIDGASGGMIAVKGVNLEDKLLWRW